MYNPRIPFYLAEVGVVFRRIHIVLMLFVFSLVAGNVWAASRSLGSSHRKAVQTRKARRSHRRGHVRRVLWNPLFRGSHELLVRENEQIDVLELPRIADDDELEMLEENEELVRMDDSRYLAVSVATANRRYCRPWTREFLEDLGAAYYEEFHRPLVITSLVRTAEQQRKLRRRNRNAAPDEGQTVSTHLTGMSFDLYKRGMTRKQHQWIESYFLPLKDQGLIEPIEERRQPVFHVTVFDGYTHWRDSQNAPADRADSVRSVAAATN